jgi:hypothetical protein
LRGVSQVEGRVDGHRFDNLARLFSAPLNRKRFLAIIAGASASAALSDEGTAKKRKKRNRGNGGDGNVDPQGANGGVCSGFCTKDAECPDSPECICDLETNRCQTVLCGGVCDNERPCQNLTGCTCVQVAGNLSLCQTATCGSSCEKGECNNVEGDSCVCDFETDLCVTIACPGSCQDNADCAEVGQDNCVCFLGAEVDVAAAVGSEGVDPAGSCGACLGAAAECNASTECCGQLVCQAGRCQRKPKPKPKKKERCAGSGKACSQDPGCCAQAICYRGQCGEKDTHCDSDNECARGYSCVGGRLTGGHRRCRRNGRKPPRNRRNRG